MATIKVKSAEIVRKFAEIKALIQETGNKVVVEEYNRPVLVIFPSDEAGNPINNGQANDAQEIERLKQKLATRRITVSSVNFD